jgi:hypothetical protein
MSEAIEVGDLVKGVSPTGQKLYGLVTGVGRKHFKLETGQILFSSAKLIGKQQKFELGDNAKVTMSPNSFWGGYHEEIKTIKGRQYRYVRWWEGKCHKSKYLGAVEAVEA